MKIECKECNKCNFLSRKKARENRKDMHTILIKVNKELKNMGYPGFSPMLVGSSKRNLIYRKSENDNEYDHDYQCLFKKEKDKISQDQYKDNLREDFINSFKKVVENDDFSWNFENSTRVVSIKKSKNGDRVAAFDFALIDDCTNQIHTLDKTQEIDTPIWNQLPSNRIEIYKKAKTLDTSSIRQEYLNKKHDYKDMSKNDTAYKTSSVLFLDTIQEMSN